MAVHFVIQSNNVNDTKVLHIRRTEESLHAAVPAGLSRFAQDSRFFNMLVSSCGLLSDEERFQRIKEIGKYNIWLAARCKNTCVKEEQEITDWIIRRCDNLYSLCEDLQALMALFELREYGVLSALMGILTKKSEYNYLHKDIAALWNNEIGTVSQAFSVIYEFLPNEMVLKLFRRIKDLGYEMDQQAYNAVMQKMENLTELESLKIEMENSGVEANGLTYFFLIRSADSFEKALSYFEAFRKVADPKVDESLYLSVYRHLILKSSIIYTTESLYRECKALALEKTKKLLRVIQDYYCKMIQECNTYEQAKTLFEEFTGEYADDWLKDINRASKTIGVRPKRLREVASNILFHYLLRLAVEPSLMLTSCQLIPTLISKYKSITLPEVCKVSVVYRKKMECDPNFQRNKELIDALESSSPYRYMTLINVTRTIDELVFVINNTDLRQYKPKKVFTTLERLGDKEARFFFDTLVEINYPLNSFICNAMIKKSDFNGAMEIVDVMKYQSIAIDLFTIQPLLGKWNTILELLLIIRLAKENGIDADEKSKYPIARRAKEVRQDVALVDFTIEKRGRMGDYMGRSWENTIYEVSNFLISSL